MNADFIISAVPGKILSSLLLLILCLSLVLGCGASRQQSVNGSVVDIDELLGEEDQSPANGDADEAEVLKLLGITPEETASIPDVTATQSDERDELAENVEQLKAELLNKDQEISELRTDLTKKEMEITDLEAEAKKEGSAVPVPQGQFGEPSPEFRADYNKALDVFKTKDYQAAISAFSSLLTNDRNNSLSDNCQYWIGECYYGLGDYNLAITEFEKVFSFPSSNKNDDAQLKLGISYFKLGELPQATAEFQQLKAVYPASEYVSLAQKYLSKL